MVTADRGALCRRAILCYTRQTYPNKELVVIDDGSEDLSPLLAQLPAEEVRYVKLPKKKENSLGRLRNFALEEARGDFLAQWDDDDWYHPDRLRQQAAVLLRNKDACTLVSTLVHVNTAELLDRPFLGFVRAGTPGTIMHRRDAKIRYPSFRRSEDSVYLLRWLRKRYVRMPRSAAHLFIRCFHGTNTWGQDHFRRKLCSTLPDRLRYWWYRYVGDLESHPRFQLDEASREAFRMYLEDSYALGLLAPPEPAISRSKSTDALR